jgi:Tfp pilus assembly protein PilO
MIHKQTKMIAIISGIFLLFSVALYLWFSMLLSEQKVVFTEKRLAFAQARANETKLSELEELLARTQDERSSLISRIPSEDDVITLLALIETVGKEKGVKLTTTSLTIEPIDGTFEMLVVGVSTEGTYDMVMNVLKTLEQLPYQTTIVKVDVGRAGENIWRSTYEVHMTKFKKI